MSACHLLATMGGPATIWWAGFHAPARMASLGGPVRETSMSACLVLARMVPSARISQEASTVFAKLDTQGKCANLQSITVNATPALTAVPAKVVWSPIIATAHLVSLENTAN